MIEKIKLNEETKHPDEDVLLRYINETANAEERALVDLWIADDNANEEMIIQLARIYYAQNTKNRIQQRNPYLVWEKMEKKEARKSRKLLFQRISVAASLIIGVLGIGSFIFQQMKADPVTQQITVTTNAGMRSQFQLPDGTTVHLNAGSTLIYPAQYDKNERRVQLSGEAYFDVTHNPKQPFIVNSLDDKVSVRVLGTQFNLQAYEKDSIITTTLVEGSVELGIKGRKENIHLSPSDKATYNVLTNNVSLKKTNTIQESGWKEDCLVFKDTPMPEVLRQLSHFFSVEFDVKDEVIRNYTFTGSFKNRPLFQILDYVKISSGINYTMVYPDHHEVRKPIISLKKVKKSSIIN